MAVFVLDASVAISWCFPGDPTENTPYSRSILSRMAVADAIVPEIWAFEIANSIFVSYNRRKRITSEQIREYLTLLKALPIRVESQGMVQNIDLESLARRRNLAAYDAAYLHLAQRTNPPLATVDGPLRDAATAEGVTIIGPSR
jgi:predicted nucleic acid-binding protein